MAFITVSNYSSNNVEIKTYNDGDEIRRIPKEKYTITPGEKNMDIDAAGRDAFWIIFGNDTAVRMTRGSHKDLGTWQEIAKGQEAEKKAKEAAAKAKAEAEAAAAAKAAAEAAAKAAAEAKANASRRHGCK